MDELPKEQVSTTLKRVYVINSDVSALPGSHWLLVYFDQDPAEVLDSLGYHINHYAQYLNDFIFKNKKTCSFNTQRLQCKDSFTCGYYCLYYAVHRCRGVCQNGILNTFTLSCKYNDHIVTKFYNDYFSM